MAEISRADLRLERPEIEPLFGPIRSGKSWHRLEERVSKVKEKGASLGVSLRACRQSLQLHLGAPNLENLRRFSRRLAASTGHVQRALGAAIERRLEAAAAPAADEAELLRLQSAELPVLAANPLQFLPGLGPAMRAIFIDPPCKTLIGPAPSGGALNAVLQAAASSKPRALLIAGPAGAGKTALLCRAYQEFSKGTRGAGPLPILLPAARLRLREGALTIDWEHLPGVPAGMGEALEARARAGGASLFIDGIDENPAALDGSDPAAMAFWGLAARNRCIITCRSKYFQRQFLNSPVHRLLAPRLDAIGLLDWSPALTQSLWRRLAASDGGRWRVLAPLTRMNPRVLGERLADVRLGGLCAWAFAVFFARHQGRFPRSSYELLDDAVELLVRWERGRTPGFPPPDVARGLLARLSWRAYQRGLGALPGFGAPDLVEIAGRDYPFLLDDRPGLFAALSRFPLLSYDGDHGSFALDRAFCCVLAAKHLLGLALRGDAGALRQALETPLNYDITESLFQGIAGLAPADRGMFLETGLRAFASARALSGRGPVLTMQGLLQLLARLGLPEAHAFLKEVQAQAGRLPEPVLLSCARALAYLGDEEGMDAHLNRLRRDPAARRTNRDFYLYWLGDGKPAGDDWTLGLRVAGWERTGRWFIEEFEGRDSVKLRAIHLHTFCDLARTHGLPACLRIAAAGVLPGLRREAAAGPPSLRRELGGLERLLQDDREARGAGAPTGVHDP